MEFYYCLVILFIHFPAANDNFKIAERSVQRHRGSYCGWPYAVTPRYHVTSLMECVMMCIQQEACEFINIRDYNGQVGDDGNVNDSRSDGNGGIICELTSFMEDEASDIPENIWEWTSYIVTP